MQTDFNMYFRLSQHQLQKGGFQNAIFKNLLVWNNKAQSFHIWYIASSRGPLLKLFKLCPWGQNWPRPGGHNFTLNYIRKSSNDIFSWTANGRLSTDSNTPIFWVRILYSEKPPIFPIFSYILNIIPIFFSELIALLLKTLFFYHFFARFARILDWN